MSVSLYAEGRKSLEEIAVNNDVVYHVTLSSGLFRDYANNKPAFMTSIEVKQYFGENIDDIQIAEDRDGEGFVNKVFDTKLIKWLDETDRQSVTHVFNDLSELDAAIPKLHQERLAEMNEKYSSKLKNNVRDVFRCTTEVGLGVAAFPLMPVGFLMTALGNKTDGPTLAGLSPVFFIKTFDNFRAPEIIRRDLEENAKNGSPLPQISYSSYKV